MKMKKSGKLLLREALGILPLKEDDTTRDANGIVDEIVEDIVSRALQMMKPSKKKVQEDTLSDDFVIV